jgi:hypothetical protein
MVTDKVSHLNVRNCFKVIGFDTVSLVRIMTLFFESQVKAVINSDRHVDRKPCSRRDVEDFLGCASYDTQGGHASLVNYVDLLEETQKLIEELISRELIENIDERFSIIKKGHSLRMQKNLKRIPLTRANSYLQKLLSVVKKINNENVFFQIDAVLLFGSVIRKEITVGDIDLSLMLTRRDHCKAKKMDYSTVERERKKIMKILRLSPYLSFIDIYSLIGMYKDDNCNFNILFLADDFSLASHNVMPEINSTTPMYKLVS